MMTDADKAPANSPHFIAVDLGSNSFHLLVSCWHKGRLVEVARNKQVVQLARGVSPQGELCPEARSRALACLYDFQAIIDRYPDAQVRAVGTQAMRGAYNAQNFLSLAEQALGCPIEIISGAEEAELTYRGIDFTCASASLNEKKLVIDIGGASTEFIIGQGNNIQCLESIQLGCVTLAERYFSQEPLSITAAKMSAAYEHSCELLSSIREQYLHCGWDVSIGASGTMAVIAQMTGRPQFIRREDLSHLIGEMLKTGTLSSGLAENLRHDVLPAGLAMLKAIFDQLSIDQLHVANATLKEGLLVSMLTPSQTALPE